MFGYGTHGDFGRRNRETVVERMDGPRGYVLAVLIPLISMKP